MNEKEARKIAESQIGEGYTLKSLGTKQNTFVFHANDDSKIPSDVIIAVNQENGKTGVSMFSIKEAVVAANRK